MEEIYTVINEHLFTQYMITMIVVLCFFSLIIHLWTREDKTLYEIELISGVTLIADGDTCKFYEDNGMLARVVRKIEHK